ncbi:hypothetical protein PGB90_001078 [Kerria lacca]
MIIPIATINDIIKNSNDIEKFTSQMESLNGQPKVRKTMKKAANETLESALYLWYIQKRSENIPLSSPIIAEKAKFFNSKLHGDPISKQVLVGWIILKISMEFVN